MTKPKGPTPGDELREIARALLDVKGTPAEQRRIVGDLLHRLAVVYGRVVNAAERIKRGGE